MKLTDEELDGILDRAGLELAQPHSPRGSYPKDGWLLTRCRKCGTLAHYRLAYVMEKNALPEATCRICFWLGWYEDYHDLTAEVIQRRLDRGYELDFLLDSGFAPKPLGTDWARAEALAGEHGYDLIGLVHGRRRGDDVMVVRCRACGRQTAERPGDVEFGCTCGGKGPGRNTYWDPDHALSAGEGR